MVKVVLKKIDRDSELFTQKRVFAKREGNPEPKYSPSGK